MAKSENIPTLAQLARQYGTITDAQYTHLTTLYELKKKEKKQPDYGRLLLAQKLATRYQLGLLQLIREYHIIRRKGEEFGKIAVKKGFAAPEDIRKALDIQKKEFRKSRLKKLIGDILVENQVITAKQKEQILKEQTIFDKKSRQILSGSPDTDVPDHGEKTETDLELSAYEQEFLRIKALDHEFSASVLEKGLASMQDVDTAREVQEQAFDRKQPIKILGDIMVSLEFITPDQKDTILLEQGRLEKREEPLITLSVSNDRMTAWIEINPTHRSEVCLPDIKSEIKAKGITHGIYPDALLQGYLDLKFFRFAVARNDHSQELRTARQLESMIDEDLTDRGEKRKGDLLIRQESHWDIPPQRDIFGKETQEFSEHDFTLRCGTGTRQTKDKTGIVAAKTGVPALSVERLLYIHPVINVLEDADQRYGRLEAYANLNVSGTITGAYPVTAGHVRAREIRGGNIEAIGDVRTDVGITDAVIRSQGDIHARYLHNCRIETFGNIYVKNEIFDSDIRCSGKVDSPTCRIISSRIHAKKGVLLAGAGSAKTLPCTIFAGTDHHVIALEEQVREKIEEITKTLRELKERRQEQKDLSKKTFQEMVELKIFHDRAKQKKEKLGREFNRKKQDYGKDRLKNILKLITDFEKRMEDSVASLKGLNKAKKKYDREHTRLGKKIDALSPKIARKIRSLEQTLFAYLEWARYQENTPTIDIRIKAFQGTRLGGVYSEVQLDADLENFSAVEIVSRETDPKMEIFHSGQEEKPA